MKFDWNAVPIAVLTDWQDPVSCYTLYNSQQRQCAGTPVAEAIVGCIGEQIRRGLKCQACLDRLREGGSFTCLPCRLRGIIHYVQLLADRPLTPALREEFRELARSAGRAEVPGRRGGNPPSGSAANPGGVQALRRDALER